jgi:dTDP-4-amino-4,6-dideoxygalactose transaminase
MRVPFYDIKAQYDELAEELDRVVHEVMASGVYSMGPHHNAFEQEIAELHGCRHGIAVNSGTDALRIMLDAAGIGDGDEVITTAFTFVASTETIVQTGAVPVFVDIDPATFMIDARQIEAAITPRTKAIMPIHLFGQIADMPAIMAVAERHGLLILEDAAQAVGARQHGKPAGQFGISAAVSYYVTKNLGAAGDAGMIVTNDDGYAERCRSIRVHGMGRKRYYYDFVGYTSRMHELQAAVLRVKLTRLAAWNRRREEIARQYLEGLACTKATLPRVSPGNEPTWHQFSVLTPNRDAVMAHMREKGVDTVIYYPVPLHFHEPYARFGHGEGSLPETERVCREIVNLPIHPHLAEEQVEQVIEAFRSS